MRRTHLFIATALLLAACKRNAASAPPPRPMLGVVSVQDVTPAADAPARLDVPSLESQLRARLLASQLFAPAAGDGAVPAGTAAAPVARVRADVAIEAAEVDEKGLARARVRLRIDTRPSDAPGAILEQLEGQGEKAYTVPPVGRHDRGAGGAGPDRPALFASLVVRMMGDLIDSYAARRRLHDGPPETVHAALTADGGELREEAIHVAGQRQLHQEVPTLLKLLSDQDEATRDAALGALIALRERRAVTELTRSRSLRDKREMRKIIEAVAILGGQEAEEYLSFVAETHDDDEIKTEAAAARARLERRAADARNRL